MLVNDPRQPRLDIVGNPLGDGQLLLGLIEVVRRLLVVVLDFLDQGLALGHGRCRLALLQKEGVQIVVLGTELDDEGELQ